MKYTSLFVYLIFTCLVVSNAENVKSSKTLPSYKTISSSLSIPSVKTIKTIIATTTTTSSNTLPVKKVITTTSKRITTCPPKGGSYITEYMSAQTNCYKFSNPLFFHTQEGCYVHKYLCLVPKSQIENEKTYCVNVKNQEYCISSKNTYDNINRACGLYSNNTKFDEEECIKSITLFNYGSLSGTKIPISNISISSNKPQVTSKTKCLPVTVTITEKETITKKETITVTVKLGATNVNDQDQNQCGSKYEQCGGMNFNGPTCCKSGLTCRRVNEYYSQCY